MPRNHPANPSLQPNHELAAIFVMTVRTCVAIPVRDEEARIRGCLHALAIQRGTIPNDVVLLVNNSTDATIARVDALRATLPFALHCVERRYPPDLAHAGTARREAMRIAAGIAGPDGLLLTSDADGAVAPDWLHNTLAALSLGPQVVCGRAEIDPVEAMAIPAHLHADDALEVAYATTLDRIHDLCDPDPADPWPRHTEHSGASIAVTVAAWAKVGGVPALSTGEDRGFLAALRRADVPIRHAPDVRVVVSGRTVGRAPGGMAETMARRLLRQDDLLDDSLEPAADALFRARARAILRRHHGLDAAPMAGIAASAGQLGLPASLLSEWLQGRFFGEIWSSIEAASPRLTRRPVERRSLATHQADADRIVAGLLRDTPAFDDYMAPLPSRQSSRSSR